MTNNLAESRLFIVNQINEACAHKQIVVEKIDDAFDLFESGAFDSLGFVSLVADIEQHFGLELDFSELEPEQFTTLKGLSDVVAEGRLASASAKNR